MRVNKRNYVTVVILTLSLCIGLFFDIKYKGAIYRLLFPEKVQSK